MTKVNFYEGDFFISNFWIPLKTCVENSNFQFIIQKIIKDMQKFYGVLIKFLLALLTLICELSAEKQSVIIRSDQNDGWNGKMVR